MARSRAALLLALIHVHSRGLATLPPIAHAARRAIARQDPSAPHGRVDLTVGEWECSSLTTGQSKSPTPKELLYCSLASCTVATIRTFHDNSRAVSSTWGVSTLEDISVEVSEVEKRNNIVPTSLSMKIKLAGTGLSPAQKRRLIDAASYCPVKRMISIPIMVELLE